MALRLGISGFGRIGRLALRALYASKVNDLEVVAVNDWKNPEAAAHLFRYDSLHGRYSGPITIGDTSIDFGHGAVQALSNRDPELLGWGGHDVDVVLECSGKFNERDKSAAHLKAGAKRVVVSAPCKNADATIVFGVNDNQLTSDHVVLSSASCTTNCLAPVAAVLDRAFGIEQGFCTTIHAYTGDQNILDGSHKDLRRGRAAGLSMVPTSTGAAEAVGEVLPSLKGKLTGSAIRVPTANVSMIDVTIRTAKSVTAAEVNAVMAEASHGPMSKVLGYNEAPLVSIDFCGDPHSSIFDATQTQVLGDRLLRVVAWYDNEWGFANRMLDVARAAGATI